MRQIEKIRVIALLLVATPTQN